MSRFQPQSIKVLGPDIYEVKAHIKGELRAPKFTFEINPLSSRVLHREKYYFSKVWDIPETEWLEKAIYSFDQARSAALAVGSPEPISVTAKDQFTYEVQTVDGRTEIITVKERNDLRTATWPHGACDARLKPSGLWKTAPEADYMLAAILMLHQAIHPKYKIAKSEQR